MCLPYHVLYLYLLSNICDMNCGRHPHKTSICNSLCVFVLYQRLQFQDSLVCCVFFDNVFDAYVAHDTISLCDASIKRGL